MRLKGRVREWRDDKGFGFIEPMLRGPSIFVHIKAFIRPGRRPQVGDLLIYEEGQGPNGRPRAERVEFSLASKGAVPVRPQSHRRPWAIPLAVVALSALAVAGAVGKVPLLIPGLYAAMSLIAFALYAWDKVSARGRRWRTEEKTLLMVGLLGGWPGSLIAQELMRHKNAKASFQTAFGGTVLLNIAAISWAHLTGYSIL